MLDPRSAWALLGDGRPAGGHGPAADAAVRGLGRGGPSSPRPHACGVLGGLRVELASRHTSWSGRARFAPRALPSALRSAGFTTLRVVRGTLPRSLALRASGGGARGNAVRGRTAASPTPPPIRAHPDALRCRDSLTRVVQIRRGRRISNAACPSAPSQAIFRSKSLSPGRERPPFAEFCPKTGPGRRCTAAGNSSRVFSLRENLGITCFRRPTCQARTLDRACHRPERASASGLGSGLAALRGYDLSILGHIFTAPGVNPHYARNAPVSPKRARNPRPRDRENGRSLRRTRGGCG